MAWESGARAWPRVAELLVGGNSAQCPPQSLIQRCASSVMIFGEIVTPCDYVNSMKWFLLAIVLVTGPDANVAKLGNDLVYLNLSNGDNTYSSRKECEE